MAGFFNIQGDSGINSQPLIERAINVIKSDYGDIVSVDRKAKELEKWGQNLVVQDVPSVIMDMKAGTFEETMLTSNGITTVSSSSGSDTQSIDFYEGHTYSSGDLTFLVENTNTALMGTSSVTLPTALARSTRARLTSPAVGDIYFHEGGATTGGVPNDGSTVHLVIPAGEVQTQKASTSVSAVDYWIVDDVSAGVLSKTSSYAQIRIEVKAASASLWYPITRWLPISDNSGGLPLFGPNKFLIIPKNHDVRMVAIANTDGIQVAGGMSGPLALIV